jgi:outer membrane lipoprotein-sorting protein
MLSRQSPARSSIAAIALLLAAGTSHAGAREEVEAAMQKFLSAKSYHVQMRHDGPQPMETTVEFVAPDRYRMTSPMGTQTIVGDTMVMSMKGTTMRVPLPKGTLTQWRDPAQLEKHRDSLQIEGLGSATLDGKPARKYRMVNSNPPGESLMWIGADGYPRMVETTGQVQGKPVTTTLRYSRFDDPAITIPLP